MKIKQTSVLILGLMSSIVQPVLAADNIIGSNIKSSSLTEERSVGNGVSDSGQSFPVKTALKSSTPVSDTPSISNSIISNAFNYGAKGSFQVDPRTGSLSISYTLASLWANGLHGQTMPLQIEYNGATDYQVYQVAKGWAFSLPYIDVPHQQAIFPSARYQLLNSNSDLQYGKLQGKQFGFTRLSDNTGYQYIAQTGTIYLFSSNGLLQSITNPLGFSVHFTYQGTQLINMSDDYGHEIKVSYNSGNTAISYQDAKGQWQNTILMLDGESRVIEVTDPFGQSSHIQYYADGSSYAGMPKLLTNPLGATVAIEYDTIEGITSNIKMPVVSKLSTKSNSYYPSAMGGGAEMNEPQVTTYTYSTTSNDHNYLGHGLVASVSATEDPMMEASISDPGYTYQTTQMTKKYGQDMTTISTYDHFHRLLKQQMMIAGKVLTENVNTYHDQVNTPYPELSASYNSPSITKTIIHGVDGVYDMSGSGSSVSESFEYDSNGLQTKHIDKYGITTQTNYADANDNGYARLALQKIEIPASISGLDNQKARIVSNKVKTLLHQYNGKTYKLDVINQSDYGTADVATNSNGILSAGNDFTLEKTESKSWNLKSGSGDYLLQSTDILSNADNSTSSQVVSGVENPEAMNLKANSTGQYLIVSRNISSADSNLPSTEKAYLSRFNGQMMIKQDSHGFKTAYTYDALGRVTSETDNYGTAEAYTVHYDYALAQGLATLTATYPDGFKKRVTYDAFGRQVLTEQSADRTSDSDDSDTWVNVSGTKYNVDGSTSEDIDYSTGNALSTQYSYTPFGKKSLIKNPDGSADVNVYDLNRGTLIQYHLISNGQVISNNYSVCHLPNGNSTTGCEVSVFNVKHYDNKTKRIDSYVFQADASAKHANGSMEYNSADQSTLNSLEGVLANGYPLNVSSLADFIATASTNNEYYTHTVTQLNGFSEYNEGDDDNPKHEIAYTIDNQGNRIDHTYNMDGQETQTQDHTTGNIVNTDYDYMGNITELSEVTANDRHYVLGQKSYDGLGVMQTSTNGSGYSEQYTYYQDAHKGQPETTTTANGDVIHYTYDDMDRPLTMEVNDIKVTYHYQTSYPFLLSSTEMQSDNGNSTTTYQYDLYQNPVSTTVSYNNAQASNTFTNTYDKYGIKQSGSDKLTNANASFKYDNLGQVIEKDYDDGHVIKYVYNNKNQLQDKLVDGLDYHYTYDNLSQVTNLTISNNQNSNTLSFSYAYDDEGRILSETDNHTVKTYEYTQIGQLKNYTCTEMSLPVSYCPRDVNGKGISSLAYSYDGLNNLTTIDKQYEDGSNAQATYSYDNTDPTQLSHYIDPANQLDASFSYDHNGNILNDQNGNTLSYDPLDNIKTVASSDGITTRYQYNAEGQQIAEQQGSGQPLYFYYNDGVIADESQFNQSSNTNKTTHFVDGGQINDGNNWVYNLSDNRNQVISHMDSQGNISDYNTYLPFGYQKNIDPKAKTFSALDIAEFDQGYNGEITDRVTGNQFLGQGYRAYNPVLHRFMKHDSDSPYGDGGLNGYIYVGNDPINAIDPTGHMARYVPYLVGSLLILAGIVFSGGLLLAPATAAEGTVADSTVAASELLASETVETESAILEDTAPEVLGGEASDEQILSKQKLRQSVRGYPLMLTANGVDTMSNPSDFGTKKAIEMSLETLGGLFGTIGLVKPALATGFGAIDNGLEGIAMSMSSTNNANAVDYISGFASGALSGFVGGFFVKGWSRYAKTNILAAGGIFAARGAVMESIRQGANIGIHVAIEGNADKFNYTDIGIAVGLTSLEGMVFAGTEKFYHTKPTHYGVAYNVSGSLFQAGSPALYSALEADKTS